MVPSLRRFTSTLHSCPNKHPTVKAQMIMWPCAHTASYQFQMHIHCNHSSQWVSYADNTYKSSIKTATCSNIPNDTSLSWRQHSIQKEGCLKPLTQNHQTAWQSNWRQDNGSECNLVRSITHTKNDTQQAPMAVGCPRTAGRSLAVHQWSLWRGYSWNCQKPAGEPVEACYLGWLCYTPQGASSPRARSYWISLLSSHVFTYLTHS